MLLPLAPEPFTVPTDRDLLPSERREFVRTHRTCVYGYRRRNDGPAMSIVYYVPTDNDELLVSTMAARGKARMVDRDGKVITSRTERLLHGDIPQPQTKVLPPTHQDVRYGPHQRNLLDFWQAPCKQPTPLLVSIGVCLRNCVFSVMPKPTPMRSACMCRPFFVIT